MKESKRTRHLNGSILQETVLEGEDGDSEPVPQKRPSYGKCPKCERFTFTEDYMPTGAYYGLCLRPECQYEPELHPIERGGVTEYVTWDEAERWIREVFARAEDNVKWHLEVEFEAKNERDNYTPEANQT